MAIYFLLQDEDQQHDPVQRQEETLEEDQAEAVNLLQSFYAEHLIQSWWLFGSILRE